MIKSFIRRVRLSFEVFFNGVLPKQNIFRPYIITPTLGATSFKFFVPDVESVAWYDINYQTVPPELRLLQAITQSHYHVLEIGVHNGFHAAMFTSLLDPDLGIYHGIELMPNCYLSALAQLKLNNAGNNFHLMQAAAGDKTGIVSYADIDSGNGSVVNSGGIPVSQITGDSLLPYFNGRIELLKIDVEGYEAFVLEGCSEILAQKPNVAIELHFSAWPGFKTTLEQVFKKINLEDYHGVFFCNPNSGELYGLEDPERIRPFNLTDLKKSDNMNVFLFSKKYFRRLPDEF